MMMLLSSNYNAIVLIVIVGILTVTMFNIPQGKHDPAMFVVVHAASFVPIQPSFLPKHVQLQKLQRQPMVSSNTNRRSRINTQQSYPKESIVRWPVTQNIPFRETHSLLFSTTSSSSSSSSSINDDSVVEDEIEAIQVLFSNYCDQDGLMTKSSVMKVPYIADLLSTGDLLMEEFDEIFDKAPKFPDPTSTTTGSTSSTSSKTTRTTTATSVTPEDDNNNDSNNKSLLLLQQEERIDIDSFVQIYRDIDDLFEIIDDNEDDGRNNVNNNSKTNDNISVTNGDNTIATISNTNSKVTTVTSNGTAKPLVSLKTNGNAISDQDNAGVLRDDGDVDNGSAFDDNDTELIVIDTMDDNNEPDPSLESELEAIYESICDRAGYITKEQLKNWDEVSKMIQDGLLGDDEFDELWETTIKSAASYDNKLDVDGFLSFNVALDDLFAFDDDEMEDEYVALLENDDDNYDDEYNNNKTDDDDIEDADDTTLADTNDIKQMVDGDGLSPEQLFKELASTEDGLVGLKELQLWKELQEMITDGDLFESELLDIFNKVKKSERNLNKINVDGFVKLYNAIDDLFEDDDTNKNSNSNKDVISSPKVIQQQQQKQQVDDTIVTYKIELLDAINDLQNSNNDNSKNDALLPCGLDATELEQREILSIVENIENDIQNNLIRSKRGNIDPTDLSGDWELIYTSSSAMKFNQGLSGLGGSVPNGRFKSLKQKLIATKYLSDVIYTEHIELNPLSASFDVTINGSWEIRSSVSLFTGEPSIVMNVVPDRVTYGITSTRADHWKSLGPMNMLDISYLDKDLRIMRGNTSIDTLFIFRRISSSKSSSKIDKTVNF